MALRATARRSATDAASEAMRLRPSPKDRVVEVAIAATAEKTRGVMPRKLVALERPATAWWAAARTADELVESAATAPLAALRARPWAEERLAIAENERAARAAKRLEDRRLALNTLAPAREMIVAVERAESAACVADLA
jgi:hypothetical protein